MANKWSGSFAAAISHAGGRAEPQIGVVPEVKQRHIAAFKGKVMQQSDREHPSPAAGARRERRGYADGLWGQVHWRQRGEGRPLILLHQSPWSSMQYHKVMPLLANGGWCVTALDTPGYGLSEPPPPGIGISAYADNVAAVMASLDIAHAVVAGHHTGALIAASLAAQHPARVEALVLDNAPFYTAAERTDRLSRAHPPAAIKPDGSHFTDRWAFMRRVADPAMSDDSVHLAVLAYFGAGIDEGHRAAFEHDFAADLALISAPTLAVSSLGDPIHHHAARILARRSDFAFVTLPGGTATVLEDPVLWTESLSRFLRHEGR